MINEDNFFDQPLRDDKITYEIIRTFATDERDDYVTGCLLDYPYFKNSYKMVAVKLSKQQALFADPK